MLALVHDQDRDTVALARDGRIWLEGRPTALPMTAGRDLAATHDRLWIARDTSVEYVRVSTPEAPPTPLAFDFGPEPRLVSSGSTLVVTNARGTWSVRGDRVLPLATRRSIVRSIGHDRVLLQDATDHDARPMVVDLADDKPRATPLALGAPVIDATCLLDRTTALLLVARPPHQELVAIRNSGSVLARIKCAKVAAIHGASQALVAALVTTDGRVIVYDLKERKVLSVDRPALAPVPVALSPDGRRLVGIADELFERTFD